MAHGVSDGNGGLYIKRTTVEKAAWSLAVFVCGLALTFFGWLGREVYTEVRALHDGQIRFLAMQDQASGEMKAVRKESDDDHSDLILHKQWDLDAHVAIERRLQVLEAVRRFDAKWKRTHPPDAEETNR